jgi:DNA-directed RNA polymerase omega subunit
MSNSILEAEALKKVGSRFQFTVLLSDRTRQLKLGAKPLIEIENGDSFYVIALKEIAAGKIDQTTRAFPQNLEKENSEEIDDSCWQDQR